MPGRQLVVVQRTDLDLDSPTGRALALMDNRSSEINLAWNRDALAELATDVATAGERLQLYMAERWPA